jgi:hypothetical protein
MRIVQSLWSVPAQASGGWEHHRGGWSEAKFFWHSWALSTHWALKHYGNVELVTDAEGARWLVDRLKLPFTSVRADVLEKVDAPGHLWAFGKIVAYAAQQESFFHIDADVYLMGKLPDRYEQAAMLCQFFEQAPAYTHFRRIYDENREAMERTLPWLPAFWRFMDERSAGNCGILGGCNIEAIQRYTRDVIELVTCAANRDQWKNVALNRFGNCVVEQQTLWCSAREQGVPLIPLFENTDFADEESLRRKAMAIGFNHAASVKTELLGLELARRVEEEFPEQYRIIERLFGQRAE